MFFKKPNLKDKIADAINYVTKVKGYQLIENEWGSDIEKKCCALGCVLVVNGKPIASDHINIDSVMKLLKVDKVWIHCFMNGFDGLSRDGMQSLPDYIDAFELGATLRCEYLSHLIKNRSCEE